MNLAYPRTSEENLIQNAIDFTYDVSNLLKDLKLQKYVYASTQSVYDDQRKKPAKEIDDLRPFDLYR